MAEIIAGLSLAANILQVLDFGGRFISTAWSIHKEEASVLKEYSTLQFTAHKLGELAGQVQQADAGQDPATLSIIKQCEKAVRRLLDCLESLDLKRDELSGLSIQAKRKRTDAIRLSLKMLWKKDDIESLQRSFEEVREQLITHLLVSIRSSALTSADQQTVLIKKLEVVQAKTDNIHSASIRTEAVGNAILAALGHMTSTSNPGINVAGIQTQLMHRIYHDNIEESKLSVQQFTLSAARRIQLEQRVLSILQYPGMEDREGRIADTFQQTFRWIYQDPPSEKHQWSNFRSWLESPNQLYWITGKAGSGKSTLMKYISSAEKEDGGCRQYLSSWVGDCRLILSQFYFWNSGYALQMTQEGLFRSLLHQSLSQALWLIPSVCRWLWELLCLFECAHDPSERELREMLVLLARNLPGDYRLCLFVDGLDEFDGDHGVLVSLFRELLVQPNVKLCVASRPWVIFEDSFRASPSLQLEYLTYDDIRQFVNTKLNDDANFRVLRDSEPGFANELVVSIVDKSSGVFLWVDLVVASLLAGMGYGDRVSDLQRRLSLLPPDLEDLYEKILLSLDKFYLEHASQYLSLVKASAMPISVLMMSFMDEPFPDFVLKQAVGPLSEEAVSRRVDVMRRRINSRCKGLLEVGPGVDESRTVQYLHRTVKDYLESPQAEAVLGSVDSPTDAALHLCAGSISLLKTIKPDEATSLRVPELVSICFAEARKVEPKNREIVFRLLDELDRTGASHAKHLSQHSKREWTPGRSALAELLAAGMWTFECPPSFQFWESPEYLIAQMRRRTADFGRSFLSVAIRLKMVDYAVSRSPRACLVQRYQLSVERPRLQDGEAVEEEPSSGQSVLWPLLFDAIPDVLSGADLDPTSVFDATSVLTVLQHGADPNFCLIDGDGSTTTPWTMMLFLAARHCHVTERSMNDVLRRADEGQALPLIAVTEAEIQRATAAFICHGATVLDPDQIGEVTERYFRQIGYSISNEGQVGFRLRQANLHLANLLRFEAANRPEKKPWWRVF